VRDLKKIQDEALRRRVKEAIEKVEAAETLRNLPNLTKLSGTSGFYRIRVGDYRIGIAVEGDEVEFVRCLHRRDIYRYFP
jgi:mRNA interferase RelE/StbE